MKMGDMHMGRNSRTPRMERLLSERVPQTHFMIDPETIQPMAFLYFWSQRHAQMWLRPVLAECRLLAPSRWYEHRQGPSAVDFWQILAFMFQIDDFDDFLLNHGSLHVPTRYRCGVSHVAVLSLLSLLKVPYPDPWSADGASQTFWQTLRERMASHILRASVECSRLVGPIISFWLYCCSKTSRPFRPN